MSHPSAAQIRAVREQAGLCPASAAAKLGLSVRRYRDMERGLLPMSLRHWCQMQSLTYRFKTPPLHGKIRGVAA
ncbi:MAG: helix-turn-helix transcriptional regulator [Pseudomonadota bacterium]|uniref:helix-turn-helix transcriptional regulator n=1 Tax=Thermithiobacillus tepidarius TaxID=929 RepID=UPI0004140847|nr:helix-turn-helix transcriptional regulator [Thermithiobacillus tepidarius]